jgi:uncharacterized protein involved in tolerance to divalent cations
MTKLTIISNTSEQASEIAHLLLSESLVIEAVLIENTKCLRLNENKEVVEKISTTINCTTKALLFEQIDSLLKAHYDKEMPVLYSVPIINMDWEQSKILIDGTKKI